MDAQPVPKEAIEAELARILDSGTFRGAERSRRLLRFIVEQTLLGQADRLKDYTLGAEVLGRGESFDPRTDPIARVESARLRSRLELYYATDGARDSVRISVPKGGYVPVFEAASPSQADASVVTSSRASTVAPRSARLTRTFGLMAVAVAAAAGAWWQSSRLPPPPSEMRLEVSTPPTPDPVSMSLAPDGLSMVFVAPTNGVPHLWVRTLASTTGRSLPGTEYASLPFWSPDGRTVGFFADGRVKRLSLETGLVEAISVAAVPAGAALNAAGTLLHPIVPDSPLFRSSAGSAPVPATRLAPGHTGHRAPSFLPDGRRFLFFAAGAPEVRGVYLGALDTTLVRRLVDADGPAIFLAPRHILYTRGTTLLGQRVHPDTLAFVGEPAVIAEHVVSEQSAGISAIAVSNTGVVAYRTGSGGKRQLIWFDRAGHEVSRLGEAGAFGPSYASLSPDGERLLVQRTTHGNTDVWMVDAGRGTAVRMTTDAHADIAPVWSPSGDRFVFASQHAGVFQLFVKPINGQPAELLLSSPEAKQPTDWARDGRTVLFRTIALTPKRDMSIWSLRLGDGSQPVALVRTPFEERDGQLSPAGRWLAYQSNESGRDEIYLQRIDGGERRRVSTDGGVQPRWRADGRELFYITLDSRLAAVPIAFAAADEATVKIGDVHLLFRAPIASLLGIGLPQYIPSRDGSRFLIDTPLDEPADPITLIFNWGTGR